MDFTTVFNEYQTLVVLIASIAILAVVMKVWWDEVSFYVLRIYSAFPVVGKIARLSRDVHSIDEKQWFHSEKTLCANFLHHYQTVNKDAAFYDKCSSYLNKTQETGRDKLHFLGWLLIAAMVFVEAMGFSYVLAGFTIPGASESLQQYGAIGIAFLISCLLVFLTHETGTELHKNKLIRKIRAWHDHEDGKLKPQKGVTLEANTVDDDAPVYQQLLNRVDTNANVTPAHYITTGTIIFVLLVAIGATYVRGMVLEEMLTTESAYPEANSGADYVDPYAAPAELQDINEDFEKSAREEIISSQKHGGWATFIVLAVIFIFLQIMGVLIGFFKSFGGNESASARSYLGKFKTREQFVSYYDRKRSRIAQIAQKNLSTLQQKMANHSQASSADGKLIQKIVNHSDRSFLAYSDTEADRDDVYRQTARVREQGFADQQSALNPEDGMAIQTESVEASMHMQPGSQAETLEVRIARIKREKAGRQQSEEKKMAVMSDEELESYLTAKGEF